MNSKSDQLQYWLNQANASEDEFMCEVRLPKKKRKFTVNLLKSIAQHVYKLPNIPLLKTRAQVCEAILKAHAGGAHSEVCEDQTRVSNADVFNLNALSNGLESANHMMNAIQGYKQSIFKNGSAIDTKQYYDFEKTTLIRQHRERVQTLDTTIRHLRQEISQHEQRLIRSQEENRRLSITIQNLQNENLKIKTCFDSYMLTIPLEVQAVISKILMGK